MEATRGNGYAPVSGMQAMMMMGIDFNGVRFDPLGSRSPPYERIKFGYPLEKV